MEQKSKPSKNKLTAVDNSSSSSLAVPSTSNDPNLQPLLKKRRLESEKKEIDSDPDWSEEGTVHL